MARAALVTLLAVAVVAVAALASTAQAQQAQQSGTAVQETPGLLERIMTNYVYPLRDMDWRTMVRNALENMMNYIAPDAKEPKIGGLPRARREAGGDAGNVVSFLGFLLEQLDLSEGEGEVKRRRKRNPHSEASNSRSLPRSNPAEEAEAEPAREDNNSSSNLGKLFFNGNSNVSSSVAGYSWAYLSMLAFYCCLSIFGALLPLHKMARDEILEATGSEGPHQPPHNHIETGNIFQI